MLMAGIPKPHPQPTLSWMYTTSVSASSDADPMVKK